MEPVSNSSKKYFHHSSLSSQGKTYTALLVNMANANIFFFSEGEQDKLGTLSVGVQNRGRNKDKQRINASKHMADSNKRLTNSVVSDNLTSGITDMPFPGVNVTNPSLLGSLNQVVSKVLSESLSVKDKITLISVFSPNEESRNAAIFLKLGKELLEKIETN